MSHPAPAAAPEPTPEGRKFRKVITNKIKAAGKRAAALGKAGAKAVATGVKIGVRETARVVSWFLAKLARGVGHLATAVLWVGTFLLAVVLLVVATVVVFVFYLLLLVTRVVQFVVLVFCTPYLAMFDRELCKLYWKAFVENVHPARLHLASPALGIARENVINLFRDRVVEATEAAADLNAGRIVDVDKAHEMALFEENDRRAQERRAKFEGRKNRPTARQRKVRPARIPRTA